ncbi:hypothetical protein D3C73_530740 [compost metagenome]
MKHYLKEGWKAALGQPFAIITLFVYQFIWGLALFRLIQSIVIQLMQRYPGADQPQSAAQLFLAESQFQLLKTDISHSYLWWLAILLGLRMLLTPLMNAGIYYSLVHSDKQAGYRFFKGMRELFIPYLLIYILQLSLTFGPLLWLLPKLKHAFAASSSYESALMDLLPWLIGVLVYGYILRFCFMHIQFSLVRQVSVASSLWLFLRHILQILLLAILLWMLSGIVAFSTMTLSYIWAGMLALLLYQLYPLIGIFLQVWTITTQYQLWLAKIER